MICAAKHMSIDENAPRFNDSRLKSPRSSPYVLFYSEMEEDKSPNSKTLRHRHSSPSSEAMDAFPLSELPTDLAIRVGRLVGEGSFRNLKGLIRSGRDGREIAYNPHVLKSLPLTEFEFRPNLINLHSRTRHFFTRCLRSGNPTALYLEGIRMICQAGQVAIGLALLRRISPKQPHHLFAKGIFLICSDESRRGRGLIHAMETMEPEFSTQLLIADQFLEFVGEIRDRNEYGVVRDWNNSLRVPQCAFRTCFFDNRCPKCYVYWTYRTVLMWVGTTSDRAAACVEGVGIFCAVSLKDGISVVVMLIGQVIKMECVKTTSTRNFQKWHKWPISPSTISFSGPNNFQIM